MKTIFLCLVALLTIYVPMQSQTTDGYKTGESTLHPPPVVNFYITGLCYGDTTHFISKTDIGEIYWAITNDKGDTLYSVKSVDTKYYFKKKGMYNICQTADNGHLATLIRTVVVDTITHADFYFRPCINEFNNLSTCADQFVWLMPDNSTTTNAFPAYQFKTGGSFPVKLTAKKGNKANTVTKMIAVPTDSLGIPDATFTFKRHGTSNVFDLKAVDSLEPNYSWTFSDLTFDDTSGYKVTHAFNMSKYEAPMNLRVSNGCGFRIYEADPFAIVGVDEYSLTENTYVFPNPATEELTISISGLHASEQLALKLTDMQGKLIKESESQASVSFNAKWDVSTLAKGIYFLELITGDQVVNKKIVIH